MADNKEESEKAKQENVSPEIKSEAKEAADDPELDDLLESALEDFDKPPPVSQAPSESTQPETSAVLPPQAGAADPMAMFEQAFAAAGDSGDGEDLQQHIAEAMRAMMGDDPAMMQHLDQLTKAANTADESEESQKAFTDTLQTTLDSLSQNAQNMQGAMTEEDIMRAMGSLGLDDAGAEGDLDFMPMMQGMLKSLLSKEVLYPSLKDISTKYPDWLSEHKSSLDATEYSNYEQQYNIMKQICEEFEQEAESDPESVKAQRFTKIMDLMQQMQNLGQPPKEIVGEMMPGVEFDDQGNPQLPNMGQQCSVM